jgi:hypothetical protein
LSGVLATQLVDACVSAGLVLVGFVGDSRIDGEVVFVAAAGHTDLGHGAAGTIAEDGPADSRGGGVADGHALGGVHGADVAQGDVLAQVVALKDDPGLIDEPLGGDAALATSLPSARAAV